MDQQRFIMALYYAHGRNDAVDVGKLDAIKFAEHYDAMWAEFRDGTTSFMPSVQDAWATWRRSLQA